MVLRSLPNTDFNLCLESGQKVRVNTEMHEASLVVVKGLLLPLITIKFINFIIEIYTEEYLSILLELLFYIVIVQPRQLKIYPSNRYDLIPFS